MKIVKWDMFDTRKYDDFENQEERETAIRILVDDIRKNRYHFSGYYHQNGESGAPVFDNGKQLQFSLRGWGGVMAEAYPDEAGGSDGTGCCAWSWKNANESLVKYPH